MKMCVIYLNDCTEMICAKIWQDEIGNYRNDFMCLIGGPTDAQKKKKNSSALLCLFSQLVQLQGYNLVGIMETWWDGSNVCSFAVKGFRLFRKYRMGRRGGGVALYMREHLECMELCLRRSEEPTGILWVGIKERTGKEDIVVGVCYRQKEEEKPSTDR